MTAEENKPTTINDLKDLEVMKDSSITPQQRLAIRNFERYRFKSLTGLNSETDFHKEFQRIQVLANLSDYTEFLKDEYL